MIKKLLAALASGWVCLGCGGAPEDEGQPAVGGQIDAYLTHIKPLLQEVRALDVEIARAVPADSIAADIRRQIGDHARGANHVDQAVFSPLFGGATGGQQYSAKKGNGRFHWSFYSVKAPFKIRAKAYICVSYKPIRYTAYRN